MAESLPDILNVDQAAQFLHVSRNTAYELVRRGVLPHAHVGRRIVLSRQQLVQWVESGGGSKDHLLGIHHSANDHARAQTGRQVVPFRRKRARA
ncbi:MAG: helix-turn-helix domain-containing protein [Firmicutes bacterium]|nr:helix-turn-helix domain-containing protein [Bacillota bacterium]